MRKLTLTAVAAALAIGVAACGREEEAGSAVSPPGGPEAAFLASMVPHHRSATEMAKVARTEATSPFVTRLARDIARSQTAEIARMERIHQRLYGTALKPDDGRHMELGLSAQEAGMNHMDGAGTIRGRKPFDRAFVDEMIPHHEGATRMAEAVLVKTKDPELTELAEGIVAAQRKEIREMSEFRERERGGPGHTSAG